jgi:hypothetical protein
MRLDDSLLVEQLQAIQRQLGRLEEQLAAVAAGQQQLLQVIRRLPAAPLEPTRFSEAPANAAPVPAQEVLTGCAQDIVQAFREVGRPLTTLEILEELVRRELRWRESTVAHTLAHLIDHGLVRNIGDGGLHRYQLRAPASEHAAPADHTAG